MTVREFSEKFYKVNIRSSHIEDTPERVARYVNILRFDIQDELSFLSYRYVEEAYRIALKDQEKACAFCFSITRARFASP